MRGGNLVIHTLQWVCGCLHTSLVRVRWRSSLSGSLRKCCDHMDAVLASQADLKPSRASGLVWVWPRYYEQYSHFQTTMSSQELRTIWSKDEKQILQVIDKDAACKVSIAASVAQVHFAEDAIKNCAIVETVLGSLMPPLLQPRRAWMNASAISRRLGVLMWNGSSRCCKHLGTRFSCRHCRTP